MAQMTSVEKRRRRESSAPEAHRFEKELRSMMYGFGDDVQTLPQSLHLMEDLVVDYLQQVLQQAHAVSEERQRGVRRAGSEAKVKERDLLFVLRKDPRRHRRVQELLDIYQANSKDATQDRPEYAKDDD
jgi:transcription initiation factor TFIID subunit 13